MKKKSKNAIIKQKKKMFVERRKRKIISFFLNVVKKVKVRPD